jgi:hypothetical protein
VQKSDCHVGVVGSVKSCPLIMRREFWLQRRLPF